MLGMKNARIAEIPKGTMRTLCGIPRFALRAPFEILPPIKNKSDNDDCTLQIDQHSIKGIKFKRQIGKGSHGTVFLVEDNNSKLMALKIIKGDDMKEAKLMKHVSNHPNIVNMVSSWRRSSSSKGNCYYYILMDYAERGDVFDIIEFYNGACPEPLASKIAVDLFSALEYIHSRNIVHRDVKPENLFVKDDGTIMLGDFGLAATIESLNGSFGTITYSAPEILNGKSHGSPKVDIWSADIWSAGVTIYTILTGNDPWTTRNESDPSPITIAKRILAGKLNRYPSHVSAAAKDFVSRCMDPDPASRISAKDALVHPWMRMSALCTFKTDK